MKKSATATVGAIFLLAAGLGILTLSPADGDNGSSYTPSCHARRVGGTYTTALGWQNRTVCQAGEFATSASGSCPNSYMKGAVLTGDPANNYNLDQQVWVMCSASGYAEWAATCCLAGTQ